MGTGHRAEGQDESYKHCSRGNGIGEQSNGNIPASKSLAHDPRPDYSGEKECRSDKFRCHASLQPESHWRPISSSRFLRASLSSDA
jgi:hypothetical protein